MPNYLFWQWSLTANGIYSLGNVFTVFNIYSSHYGWSIAWSNVKKVVPKQVTGFEVANQQLCSFDSIFQALRHSYGWTHDGCIINLFVVEEQSEFMKLTVLSLCSVYGWDRNEESSVATKKTYTYVWYRAETLLYKHEKKKAQRSLSEKVSCVNNFSK